MTEPHAKTNGVIGGVLGGYNWQTDPVVFGLEGDFSWTNAHGTGTVTPPPPPTVITTQLPNTYDVNWTSHVRGRLGYAADRWLFFVAGGLAIADFDFQEGATITTIIPPSPGGTTSDGLLAAALSMPSRKISWDASSFCMMTSATRITSARMVIPIASS